MICYVDEVYWKRELADVPQALKQKRINEAGAALDAQFPTTAHGNGWVQIDLSGNPNARQEIFPYLQRAGIAAVDVQPSDIFYLCGGRNFGSLALTRAIERGDIVLNTVEPSELFDRLNDALRTVQFPTASADDGPEADIDRAIAQEDLISSGILDRQEIDSTDAWLNRDRKAQTDDDVAFDREVREEMARREEAAFDPFYAGENW